MQTQLPNKRLFFVNYALKAGKGVTFSYLIVATSDADRYLQQAA